LPFITELSGKLEERIIDIFEGHMWPDDLDRMYDAIEKQREVLSGDVFEAANGAVTRGIDHAMSDAAAIDSESTLEDHAKALGRLAPRAGITEPKLKQALSQIQSRISEINENAEEASPSHPLEERVGERTSVEILSEIKDQTPKIENGGNGQRPEVCHSCRSALPALLPDGERPFTHCQRCGTALHSPHNRHLYCPACATDLRIIIVNGQRILSNCPCCGAPLPPWSPPT